MKIPIQYIKKIPNWVWLGSAAAVVLYVIKKGGVKSAAEGVIAGVVGSAGDVIIGAGQGSILGAGDVLGLPRTNETQCQAAIRRGDNLAASKYCSAGVFSKWQYLSLKKRLTGKGFTMADIFN